MQMPHFELMTDNTVKLCGFDHLAEQFVCTITNDYLYLQPYIEGYKFDEHHLLISRNKDFIVDDPTFYRLIKTMKSDELKYFYVNATNSYIPVL